MPSGYLDRVITIGGIALPGSFFLRIMTRQRPFQLSLRCTAIPATQPILTTTLGSPNAYLWMVSR